MNRKIKEKLNIKNSITRIKKGMGLVEVLVGVFIFTIILSSLILISNMYLSGAGDNLRLTQAAYLAEEGIEAVKTIRDNNWTNITDLISETNYCLVFNYASSTWLTTSNMNMCTNTGSFYRTFKIKEVKRDSVSKDISEFGVDSDDKTRELIMSVSWLGRTGSTTKTLKTYITDILGE